MEFKTISEDISSELVEKKSKFIANLMYTNNKNEAEEKIKELKRKYFDARHNCIAYRVLEEDSILEKSSDDGEPFGTAGAPMLNILQKNNLCNVLVVVTRYFGGILLGTGGLVRCYSQSTLNVIKLANVINICDGSEFKIKLDYGEIENFKYYCKINNINIIDIKYNEKIECNIEIQKENKNIFLNDIEERKINILENKEVYEKYIMKK